MIRKAEILLLICCCTGWLSSFAQSPALSVDTAGVVLHTDPRLELISDYLKPANASKRNAASSVKSGVIRSGRGFRVQIYSGNDRNKAIETKVEFMRRFPSVRTYMTYIQPQFRVKVGDFTSRAEAARFLQQINSIFSPVMIVPDIIIINSFKNDQ